jgi:DNA repair protein RecO
VSAEFGRKRGVARGARRKYSRFAGQLQPLARARIEWFEKDGRELVRISDLQLSRAPHRLHADLEGILLGAYLAEHVATFAQEDEACGPLFRLLDVTVDHLLAGGDRTLAARYFETWVLRLAGIFPPPRECPSCLRPFDEGRAVLPDGGEGLVCPECAHGHEGTLIVAPVLEFLLASAHRSLAEMAEEPPAEPVLKKVEKLCGQVRRSFLGRELRSYEVMQRTLVEVG